MIRGEGEHGEFLPVGVRSMRMVKPDHAKRFCFLAPQLEVQHHLFSPKAVLQRIERRSPPDDIFSWTSALKGVTHCSVNHRHYWKSHNDPGLCGEGHYLGIRTFHWLTTHLF